MTMKCIGLTYLQIVCLSTLFFINLQLAGEDNVKKTKDNGSMTWQEKAVRNAQIMSRVKWTPVAKGMPIRGKGYFKKGIEYTGVPYSSVKYEGRYIGFDIFLKTFLAAVQNPLSVVYTENLSDKVTNSACYYGKVCSSYTSYALQCGIWYISRHHGLPYSKGVIPVEPQSAQGAKAGDFIYTPPSKLGEVEIVTKITKNKDGQITSVQLENRSSKTPRKVQYIARKLQKELSTKQKRLYRITNPSVLDKILSLEQKYITPYSFNCKGVDLVKPQSVQAAKVGDVFYTLPSGGSHVEIVTKVNKNQDGQVTSVRIEESSPPTTRNTLRNDKQFNKHLAVRNKTLFRITDFNVWRGKNNAESFLFPNYEEDSSIPVINRVLLLDRGDWVAYLRGQVVRINIMDRDKKGVKKLVVKRGDTIVEEIPITKKGVIERSFSVYGNYSAYCVMADGSHSQACEFSVCDLDLRLPDKSVILGKPLKVKFSSDNMKIILAYLFSDDASGYGAYNIYITDEDRRKGEVVIPGDLVKDSGNLQIWLIGENTYGRLKKRQDIVVKERKKLF